MRPSTVVWLLLSIVGISVSAFSGGVGGVLFIAMLHPGVKGPHITDNQMVGAFIVGGLLGGGLASLLVVWMRKRRR